MAKLLKLRRGTTSQHGSFTGAEGECTVDTDKETLVVHNGSQAGGYPLLRQDLNNIATGTITASMLGTNAVTEAKLATDSVTVNKIANGSVTGAKIANHTITNDDINASAAIELSKLASTGAIGSAVTATTQSASDNSTKIATTAYVETAVSNLVDSSPAALNTLNELAAAINDDANFSTTMTNNLATKFANAGGSTITGDFTIASGTTNKNINVDVSDKIRFDDNLKATFGSSDDLEIYHDASHSWIKNSTGNLYINPKGAEVGIALVPDGKVELRYNDSTKFETMDNGSQITGRVYSTDGYFGLDATDSMQFVNNDRIDFYINDSNEFRMTAAGNFHADGDVVAFSTTVASDENLKDNIEEVTDALSKCQAIRGVTFDWKKTGEKSAGVIAQDIQNVLPEAVKEIKSLKDNSTHLTVNYHALMSILIEAIKELKGKVDVLEAK